MWWWAGALLSGVEKKKELYFWNFPKSRKTCFTLLFLVSLRTLQEEDFFADFWVAGTAGSAEYVHIKHKIQEHYNITQHNTFKSHFNVFVSWWSDLNQWPNCSFNEWMSMSLRLRHLLKIQMTHTQHARTQSSKCSSVIFKNVKHGAQTLLKTAKSSRFISS